MLYQIRTYFTDTIFQIIRILTFFTKPFFSFRICLICKNHKRNKVWKRGTSDPLLPKVHSSFFQMTQIIREKTTSSDLHMRRMFFYHGISTFKDLKKAVCRIYPFQTVSIKNHLHLPGVYFFNTIAPYQMHNQLPDKFLPYWKRINHIVLFFIQKEILIRSVYPFYLFFHVKKRFQSIFYQEIQYII